MLAGVIAAFQLLATIVGLYFIKGTLDETAKAVAETGKATEAMLEANEIARTAQRPWVQIDSVHLDRIELKHNARYGHFISALARAEVENVGKLPAMEVACMPYIWLFSIADPNAPTLDWSEGPARALADALARAAKWERSIGRMIYPGQSETLSNQTSTMAMPLPGMLPVDMEYPFPVDINVTFVILYKISADDWRHSVTTVTVRFVTIKDWLDAGGSTPGNIQINRVAFMDKAN